VTVRVIQKNPELCELAKKRDIPYYWGFEIQASKKTLGEIALARYYDLMISTSRLGDSIKVKQDELKAKWEDSKSILVVFGSPRFGVAEILSRERHTVPELFDFNVNTIPNQGCETVRVEEALHATLTILNLLDP
jgi:predicted SPOUT superfamily RNA methylase MTH1